MVLKILYWIGLAACVMLIVSCFIPWTHYNDASIANPADRTFTGFYSFGNNYGRPGKFLVLLATLAFIFMILPKIWAKRTNLFVCALNVGYAIKSYILFTSCYNAYCPEKKAGIFIMLFSSLVMLIASAFPKLELAPAENKEPE